MKKIIAGFLVFVMMLSFASCATQNTAVSVENASVDENGNLIIYLTDGSTINAGYVKGEPGEKGEKGDTGETGPQGEKGDVGETGPQGAQGIQGEKGEDGKDGRDGRNGKDGKDGASSLPESIITEDGKEVEFRIKDVEGKPYLQYRYVDSENWITCFPTTLIEKDEESSENNQKVFPDTVEIEITKDNFYDYFEIEIEEPIIVWSEDVWGAVDGVSVWVPFLKLKDEYVKRLVDEDDYETNYQHVLNLQLKCISNVYPCTIDFLNRTLVYNENSPVEINKEEIDDTYFESGSFVFKMTKREYLSLSESRSWYDDSTASTTIEIPTSFELLQVKGSICLYSEVPEWRK